MTHSGLDLGAPAGGAIRPQDVASAHNAMAGEYDQLDDLWYPWLFVQVHELIARNLPRDGRRLAALDAGCGTGFQSFLLARAGHDVEGFDIAGELVEVARAKAAAHARPPLGAPPLFRARSWPHAAEHHARLAQALEAARRGREVRPPRFFVGDLTTHDFRERSLDVVVSCGSALSFVDDYAAALAGMARALRPGGLLFLEIEQRVSLDLLWPVADALLGGRLGYRHPWPAIWRSLAWRHGRSLRVDYPFPLHSGRSVLLPMRLFAVGELLDLFRANGLAVRERLGIHVLTNLLPSTLLHQSAAPARRRRLVARLADLEARLAGKPPFWRLGCNVAFCLQRA